MVFILSWVRVGGKGAEKPSRRKKYPPPSSTRRHGLWLRLGLESGTSRESKSVLHLEFPFTPSPPFRLAKFKLQWFGILWQF